MIREILSNRVLIRFLRWCFGSALITQKVTGMEDPVQMEEEMILVLKKEEE